jgi:hypothetical protein
VALARVGAAASVVADGHDEPVVVDEDVTEARVAAACLATFVRASVTT